MGCSIRRGKIILLIIICMVLLLDATTTTLVTIKFGLYRLPHGLVRFLVTATFMYFIYKGTNWVKNVFVGLLLFAVVSPLINYNEEILLNPLMLLVLAIHSVSAVLLMFSRDIKCFLEKQNKEYSWDELDKSYDEKNFSYMQFWEYYNKLTKTMIEEIPDEKLLDVIYDFVIYNIDDKYGLDEENILMQMPELYRMVFTIRMFEAEINNGGYDQYFFNSTGYHVYEAIDYLNKIGANKTAELTQKALSLVNSQNLTKENFKNKQINRILEYDDVFEQLDKLDDKFYEYPDDLDNHLIQYIRNNINSLD